ncbi:cyclic AMP-dependent transcription factor ATF-2-like isoform X3 [Sycon ciliatum]|uniref:cyclic AMP-dependent transcription factor ATF-2-like isoform X3 n=1 Tax=Sycon ciliatum TaxID=27933 RepID=UPI0031F6FD62
MKLRVTARLLWTISLDADDQTPTPTRFLRVCDAEGLFQDMQKSANPFDEGFQAGIQKNSQEPTNQFSGVETLAAVAVASAAASPSHSDDDQKPGENGGVAGASATVPPTTSTTYAISQANRLTGPFMNGNVVVPVPPPASLANPDASVPMAIPPTSFLKGGATSGGVPSSVRSTAKTVSPETKKRIQQTLSQMHPTAVTSIADRSAVEAAVSIANTVMKQTESVMPTAASATASSSELGMDEDDIDTHTVHLSMDGSIAGSEFDESMSSIGDGSQHSLDGTPGRPSSSTKRKRVSDDVDPTEKRARFLQRNREAATRCREKRKEWIATLERRAQDLARQNAQLQAEVNALRNERAHLKVLLLSHKDCPVTVQQQKSMQIPASLLPQSGVAQSTTAGSGSNATAGSTTEDSEPPVAEVAAVESGNAAVAGDATAATAAATATAPAVGPIAAAVAGLSSSQNMALGVPSLVMPVPNPAAASDGTGQVPKGAVTLALPAPLNVTGANQGVNSPLTPLLMFPLTSDHLQMAAAATATPNVDMNSLNILQQLQQQVQRTGAPNFVETSPQKAAAGGTTPATPSTAAIQALLGSAQLAVLQAALQQQQQQLQQQALQQVTSQVVAGPGAEVIAEPAPGEPLMEEVQEVELQ